MPKMVLFLVAFVVTISIVGLIVPSSSIYAFFLPSQDTSIACLILSACLLVLYVLTDVREFKDFKDLLASSMGIAGSSLISIAAIGFLFPTYFGMFYNFVPQASLMTMLVLGVSYSMVGLAVPHRNIIDQMAELKGIITFRGIRAMEADLKLWMFNHTSASFKTKYI